MYMDKEINFKKKFGQNFLSDSNLLKAIVEDSKIDNTDVIVEVGAGAGALTEKLCQKAKKVYAFEIDTELESILHEIEENNSNLQVVFDDFMNISPLKLKEIAGDNFAVVANLPYYITSPLITKFLTCNLNVKSLTVMVQYEVAQRIVALPNSKEYGVLSVIVGLCGNAKITRKVNRKMFTPVPNVDSAIVHILVEEIPNQYVQIIEFVKKCFASRRKTIVNNLGRYFDKSLVLDNLQLLNIPASARAENLSPKDFQALYGLFYKNI